MAELKYWLWFTERRGLEGRKRTELLEQLGSPERVYFADEEEYRFLGVNDRAIRSLCDKSLEGAHRILGDCERLGIHIMTMQDAAYPERLRVIPQPPLVLYWKGREIAFDDEAAIAVVGTREATPYGLQMARQLSLDLTRAGALVLSAGDVLCELVDRFPGKLGRRPPMTAREREQRLEELETRQEPIPPKASAKPAPEKEVDNASGVEYIDWQDCQSKLNEEQKCVLLALQEGNMTADDLVERTQIEARRVLAALTILQIQGLAAEESGNRFRAAVRLKME